MLMDCPCCRSPRFALPMRLNGDIYECGCGYAVSVSSLKVENQFVAIK